MRGISGALRALLAARRLRITTRCELTDQNGMWRDVTNWLGTNWFDEATWTENFDQPVSTGTITLARVDESLGISLAPHIGASPANQVGGLYDPFIVEGRGARLSIAITAAGVAPVGGDFVEVFVGSVDDYTESSTNNAIALSVRDLGARVVDAQIESKRTYAADEGGMLLEDVAQQMLDDVLGAGVVTLYVPVSPATAVANIAVDSKSLLEAMRDLALSIGWDIRYRYDAAGVSRLTLWQPPRGKVNGQEDAWLAASEYIAIPKLSTSRVDIRNVVRVDFTNADTGEPDFLEDEDAISIAKYDRKWMALSFAANGTINTPVEAARLIDVALSDLSTPFSDHDAELFPCWWPVQLGDFLGFRANTLVYDSDQRFGVFGFTHTLSNASGSTTLVTKGKVVGAFREWSRRSRSEAGTGEPIEPDTRALALKNFREIRRTPTVVRFGWDADPEIAAIWAWGKRSAQEADPPPAEGVNPEDRLWRDIENETPDRRLTGDTEFFDVDVPPHGDIQTWELMPFSADGDRGYGQRIKVLSTPDVPRFNGVTTQTGATGLFLDILTLNVVDPQALGGTLRVWLNHDEPVDPDPSVDPYDGTLVIALTPHVVTPADVFTLGDGPFTTQLFDNVRIHAGRGKRVYFEFINAQGTSSGVVGYNLLSNGGILDADGNILDGSINSAAAFAASIQPISVYDTLPSVGRANEVAFLTSDKKLYRWTGSAWDRLTPAADISGVLTAEQLADAIISTAKFAAGIRPVEILTSLPASPGPGRVALLTSDGKLYRSSSDGLSWTAAVPTVDLTGQVTTAQLEDALLTTAKFASGIKPVEILAVLPASPGVGRVAYLTSDGKLYRSSADGTTWTASVPSADLTGQITSTQITDGAITTPKVFAGAITTALLAAGAVTANELAANSVIAGKIAAASISATEIAAGAITTLKLAAGAVTTLILAAGAVTATEIAAGAITTLKIAANAVTASQIAVNTITAGQIAAGAISATEIASNAITSTKIAAGQVVTGHMSAGTIDGDRISARTLNAGALIANSITSSELAASSVTAGSIAAGAITATAIQAGAVTAIKISVTSLAEVSVDAGILVRGKLTSLDGLRYLDLDATGASPFLQHPAFAIYADGSAVFAGTVSSSIFTASTAAFSGHIFLGAAAELRWTDLSVPAISKIRHVNGRDIEIIPGRDLLLSVGGANQITSTAAQVNLNFGAGGIGLYLDGRVVQFGAANSGGAGYRLMLVVN